MQGICVNDINTFIQQCFTQIGNLAKIEMNCLEQWVMSITEPLCHLSYEVLLLQRQEIHTHSDLNLTFTPKVLQPPLQLYSRCYGGIFSMTLVLACATLLMLS